jgi:HSP20 family protein
MFYAASWKPATDMFRAGDDWLIKMELAGVAPGEVQLLAQRNVLHVKGRRRDLVVHGGYTCHKLEINYTNFERSITLPGVIDAGDIRTEYRDGILRIYLRTL